MNLKFLVCENSIKLKKYNFQHMDVLGPGGVGWSSQAMDGQSFLSRKQKQDVSASQGLAMPILWSEVQEARSSDLPPLFFQSGI